MMTLKRFLHTRCAGGRNVAGAMTFARPATYAAQGLSSQTDRSEVPVRTGAGFDRFHCEQPRTLGTCNKCRDSSAYVPCRIRITKKVLGN